MYLASLEWFNADFRTLDEAKRSRLAGLVNNTKACAQLLGTQISPAEETAEP